MANICDQGGSNRLPSALSGDTLIDCSRNHVIYPDGVPLRLLADLFVVPTVNEITGEVTYNQAYACKVGTSPCIELTVYRPIVPDNDSDDDVEYRTIVCTPNQGFLSATSHQYKPAWNLEYGDRIQTSRAVSYIFQPDGKYRTRQRSECRVKVGIDWSGRSTIKYEHRLIAEALYGKIPEKYQVHHPVPFNVQPPGILFQRHVDRFGGHGVLLSHFATGYRSR